MASLIAKWQKCGKQGCRCIEGTPHGPYFWLLTYVSKKSLDKHRGKYTWRYLGKNPQKVWTQLKAHDQRFEQRYTLDDLTQKVHRLYSQRTQTPYKKMSEPILEIKEAHFGQ